MEGGGAGTDRKHDNPGHIGEQLLGLANCKALAGAGTAYNHHRPPVFVNNRVDRLVLPRPKRHRLPGCVLPRSVPVKTPGPRICFRVTNHYVN